MAFVPNEAQWPTTETAPPDARMTDLFVPENGDFVMVGLPSDTAVIGRRGAKGGPTGIREAMRFIAGHDNQTGLALSASIMDEGDVDLPNEDVLSIHAAAQVAIEQIAGNGRLLVLGGDHGLTFATVAALAAKTEGSIGIVVIDAHYDLRAWEGQPTSGTPFRRIIEELGGRVLPEHIVEIGIRPFANAPSLAEYAKEKGVIIHQMHEVRNLGIATIIKESMRTLVDVDHIWLTVDIDGLDQSIASGCSAPGAGGLSFDEADAMVRAVAADPRCRGMDVMEVAPSLDPTGNTCRTAAQLLASFIGSSP